MCTHAHRYAMPRGWKPQLGCASLEAAEAATAAALKLVQEIKSKGRHACIKVGGVVQQHKEGA